MTSSQDNTTSPDPEDKRTSPRRRVLKEAFASFNEQFSAVPCRVRNMSEKGAMLHFDDMSLVPDEFMLHVPLDGIKVKCRRVRNAGPYCGVEFISAPERSNMHRRQIVAPTRADDESERARPAPRDDGGQRAAEAPSAPPSRRKPTFGRRS
ncbi:PilZ domain-containing protein [Oricola cellulosilytica]|uniref:PilZ domain-containing protein n=1 Tax=Oricola cellulosilytica TaxID=1429082 RepID=A0A4R0P2B4_9HYPH|nr:PilZ domain-containing protein [Oricola cellulosilytica]TCD10967.1 PilZ domain-containing protein [Oricola cellulosilytica]